MYGTYGMEDSVAIVNLECLGGWILMVTEDDGVIVGRLKED